MSVPTRGLASAPARFQERAQTTRRGPWGRLVVAASVVVGLLVLGWVVLASPLLTVRTVEVVGVQGAEARAARALAEAAIGRPLARVDTDVIAAQVQARKAVRTATVERTWPSTLTVRVSPRVAALVVSSPRGRLQVADSEGVVFATVPTAPAGVPVVRAAGNGELSPPALAAALAVVRALPRDLAERTSAVTVTSASLVTLRVGTVTVVWGGAADSALKAEVVRALLKTRPTTIDVSAPRTPVTR